MPRAEKTVKSKACPYCEDGEVIAWDMCNDGIVIESDGKISTLAAGDWEADINFCPMCGKDLRREADLPLTLDELRQMDGEPVWLHSFSAAQKKIRVSCWAIITDITPGHITFVRAAANVHMKQWFSNYGNTWLAYRRRPEEGNIQ